MHYNLKIWIRDFLPPKYQVPIKYWHNKLYGNLEKEMNFLPWIVKNNCNVVDIGGNRGIYAYYLWKLGAKVKIFEPNPKCCTILSSWAKNKVDVELYSVGLSNYEGEASLHIPVDKDGQEHDALASIEEIDSASSRDEFILVKTLDSYHLEDIDMIKIDVEGHEYNVIEGAIQTISKSKPALLIEIEQRHSARPIIKVFEKILSLGYSGFFLKGNELLELKRFNIALHQSMDNFGYKEKYLNNFLFLHSNKLEDGSYDLLMHKYNRQAL